MAYEKYVDPWVRRMMQGKQRQGTGAEGRSFPLWKYTVPQVIGEAFGWRCILYSADTYRGDSSPYVVVHTTTPACMVIYRQFCTLRCKSIDTFVDYYSEFPSKHIEIFYTRFSIFHKVGPSWNVTFVTHMCVTGYRVDSDVSWQTYLILVLVARSPSSFSSLNTGT
jgi:hypothetical protein